MTIIKFKDSTEIEALVVNASAQFVQGTNRDVLEFVFAKEGNSVDTISEIFTDILKIENLSLVTNEGEFLYNDYTVQTSKFIAVENDLITPETSETEAVYEQRIKVQLAKETYMEKMIRTNTARLEEMRVESAQTSTDLFEMIITMTSGV